MCDGSIGTGKSSTGTIHDLIHFPAPSRCNERTTILRTSTISSLQEISGTSFNTYLAYVSSHPFRTCCKVLGMNLAAYETAVPRMFQTCFCSHTHARKQIYYQLTRSGRHINGVLYTTETLMFWTNQPTFFLPVHPGPSDEYLPGPAKLGNPLRLIFPE